MDGLGTDGGHKPSCERDCDSFWSDGSSVRGPRPPSPNFEKSIYYVCDADLAALESEARYEPATVNKASHFCDELYTDCS